MTPHPETTYLPGQEVVWTGLSHQFERLVRIMEGRQCKGMLGLWRLPEDVEKAVRAQLEATGGH